MEQIMPIDTTPTLELLARAIDVTALRQGVYAANIANAGVGDYRRMEVTVEQDAVPAQAGLDVAPSIVTTESAVKLDEEMARMAKNTLRYQILLGAFERSMSTLRLAVREGRE
jgi:flagellar basal-body rod protein FlgB